MTPSCTFEPVWFKGTASPQEELIHGSLAGYTPQTGVSAPNWAQVI